MKSFWKRLAALLLAVTMLLSPGVMASAEGDDSGEAPDPDEETAEDLEPESGTEDPGQETGTQLMELPVVYIECPISPKSDYTQATFTLVETDGRVSIDKQSILLCVHGRSTARAYKKPYSVKFPSDTDVLEMGAARKWILLANAYDKTLIRNKLMYDLSQELGMAYPIESRFVELYFNGRYRGNYQIAEAPQINSERVDVNPAKNEFLLEIVSNRRIPDGPFVVTPKFSVRLELNSLDYLPPDQEEYLNDFFLQAETALLSHDREQIEQYFDIDSFVNGYILYEFSKNPDLSQGSTRFTLQGGKLYMGPAWDFDLALGNDPVNCDFLHIINGTRPAYTNGWYACQFWFRELIKCDWFQEAFAARYREIQPILVNLYEDNELGQNRIDQLVEEMEESIAHNYTLWSVNKRYYKNERIASPTYEKNLEFMRDWIRQRNEWIMKELDAGRGPKLA